MKNQLEKGDIIRVHGSCFPYFNIGQVCQSCGRGWIDFEVINFDPTGDFYWYDCISLSNSQESKKFMLKYHPHLGWFHTGDDTVTGLTVTKIIGPHWTRKPKLKDEVKENAPNN